MFRIFDDNLAWNDYRIWLHPFLHIADAPRLVHAPFWQLPQIECRDTVSTAIIHRSLVWYRLDYHSISLDFILISFPSISPFSHSLYSELTHGFSAHATLPDVFHCQIKALMIGHLNANLLACQCYIYPYCLYGRTVDNHLSIILGWWGQRPIAL